MSRLSLPPASAQISSVPEINNAAQIWLQLLIDSITKWANGSIDGTNFRALPYTAFTPSWTASGTAPALGNGTLTGKIFQLGKFTQVRIKLTAGSTTTFGTGTWSFSIPLTAADADWNGSAQAFDSSAGAVYSAMTLHNGVTTTISALTDAQPGVNVSNTVPFTWATSDTLVLTHSYEAA